MNCIFCKEPCIRRLIDDYICLNHKYSVSYGAHRLIKMSSNIYYIDVYEDNIKVYPKIGWAIPVIELPSLPENWTPENMDEKIKLLLAFS